MILFVIADGRTRFYQWDTDVKLNVVGMNTGEEVHFYNKNSTEPYNVKIDENKQVTVPPELLQEALNITVCGYDLSKTLCKAEFSVVERMKPADYVYTPTEIMTVEKLAQDLQDKVDSGYFNGKDYVLTDADKQEIAEMVDVKAGGESWRKLFELTTAQETAMIEQTTDDNGDVFKLKKAVIKIDFPAVSRCCAECTIDLHPADEENEIYYSLYMDNNAMANQEPYTNIASVNTKPFVNSELVEYKSASISIDDNTSNGAFSIATRILRPIPYLDYVDYFALYDLGGKNIPSGTKITMWGVDDD